MRLWGGGGAAGMLWAALALPVLLAALALRCAGEPAPRAPADWHPASPVARGNPLAEVFLDRKASGHPAKERRRPKAWNKRTQRIGNPIASTMMMQRTTRSGRLYDVPQINCPIAEDGMERFSCPASDRQGRYRCIDDHMLCDGFIDCPNGEDEDRQNCLFYKTTKAHLDVLADALLRWARGR